MYQVIERTSGRVVGTYSTIRRARSRADKLDLQYGCINYSVKPVVATVANAK